MAALNPVTKCRDTLFVTIAKPEDYDTLHKTAALWQKIADAKKATAPLKWPSTSLLWDSVYTNQRFQYLLGKELPPSAEVYVCKDSDQRIQGLCLAYLQEDGLEIETLATHPHNLASPLNNSEEHRAKGTGSALIAYAEQRAAEFGSARIYLSYTDSALHFYKKLGFEMVDFKVLSKPVTLQKAS